MGVVVKVGVATDLSQGHGHMRGLSCHVVLFLLSPFPLLSSLLPFCLSVCLAPWLSVFYFFSFFSFSLVCLFVYSFIHQDHAQRPSNPKMLCDRE